MSATAVYVRPFEVGWKVQYPLPLRGAGEAVTGRRETAIELAQYYAQRSESANVVICREDGSVEEQIAASLVG